MAQKGDLMKTLTLALLLLSPSAFANYVDGTYFCKNPSKDLPDNMYMINTVQVGGASLPTVDITRYIKKGNETDTILIKGLASVHTTTSTKTTSLRLGSVVLEFVDGDFVNCKK